MLEKFRDILEEYVEVPRKQITQDTNLLTDLQLSSLDVVDIIVAIEDELGILIPDRKLSEIITVGDVIRLLKDEYGIS